MRWSRLDNAATIFPPTSHGADTGVFRLCCELRQDVDPERLQLALEQTLEDFPHMKSCLRRGVFWYYLEQSGRPLHVVPAVPGQPLAVAGGELLAAQDQSGYLPCAR